MTQQNISATEQGLFGVYETTFTILDGQTESGEVTLYGTRAYLILLPKDWNSAHSIGVRIIDSDDTEYRLTESGSDWVGDPAGSSASYGPAIPFLMPAGLVVKRMKIISSAAVSGNQVGTVLSRTGS